jgi:hypothetical protein
MNDTVHYTKINTLKHNLHSELKAKIPATEESFDYPLREKAYNGITAYKALPRNNKGHLGLFARNFDNQRGTNRANIYHNLLSNCNSGFEVNVVLLTLLTESGGTELKKIVVKSLGFSSVEEAGKSLKQKITDELKIGNIYIKNMAQTMSEIESNIMSPIARLANNNHVHLSEYKQYLEKLSKFQEKIISGHMHTSKFK